MTVHFYKEPLHRQIILLVCFFVATLAAVIVGQEMIQKELGDINALRRNELDRIEMSYLIHIELQKVQSLFQKMSFCKTEHELAFFDKQIRTTVTKVEDLINVIDQGGTTTYTYKVNFGNEEEIRRNFTYRDYRQDQLHIETLELRSKVKDLLKHQLKFKELVQQRIHTASKEQLPRLEEKILFFYKGVDPYFQRIFETSYRIYFSAQNEMERLHVQAETTEKKNTIRFLILLTVAGLLVIRLTEKVLVNIKGILKERNAFQTELIKTNENLEQTILDRTGKLHAEIRERQKAEEKEQQQAIFLKTIINSLAHPFYVVDVETYEIKLLNDFARQFNPGNNRFCYSLIHHRQQPCSGDEQPCPLSQVKQSGQPVIMEHIHYDQNGEKSYIEVHGHPVLNSEGKVIQMIEYQLDVTKRKLAEMALEEAHRNMEATVLERTASLKNEIEKRRKLQEYFQQSEHYYRTLIESSNDLISIIDTTGTITYVSPSIQGMLGYSPTCIEGRNLYDYLHPDDIRFGKDQFGAFLASLVPEKRLEHRIRTSDGRYLVLESSFHNLVHDKTINGLLLTARDITAKRESDALMRKLQLVIEQSPNSVVITNKDGIIEYVNPQFEKITGYSRSEALAQNPRILKSGLTPPETFTDMWETVSRGNIWQGEFANRKKNGDIYYENVVIAPLKNEHDTITHYVAMKENITELKKAREQAEASNKAKSQFLSRMSHELRTPLNAINGFSRLLIDSKKHPLAPRQMEQVLQINSAGHYLLALINEILDLARIESGRFALSIENIPPLESITSCLALVESLAFNNKVSIRVDDSIQKLPPLKADRTRFKQIMLNLLSNAVKYNRPEGTVTITGAVENQMATIRVIDTGIGIAPEKQQDIFVPFTRLGQDNSPIEGTGIGMTITRQLLELMGGAIGLTSVPEIGSTFWITLPLAGSADMSTKVSTPFPEQDKSTSPQVMILYIEDRAVDIAHIRKLMLQWPQVALVIRKTVEKGIQAVEMLHPDLIFLNINFPEANGSDILHLLRQNPEAHHTPVIALGSDHSADRAGKYRELGYDDYITQPVNEQKLNDILLSILKGQDHA